MDLMESRGEAFASESLESLDRFVLGIAKALVDTPSSVRLETTSDHQVIVLRLYVAPEEIGQLIGSQGRIARALRTIPSTPISAFRHPLSATRTSPDGGGMHKEGLS